MPWFAAIAAIASGAIAAAGQPDYTGMAQGAEKKRQARINTGLDEVNKVFGSFTPEVYSGREKAYLDFALPQENQQYNQAQKQLTYGLANKGLNKSSMADTAWSSLNRAAGAARQGIADTAIGQASALKSNVANAKSGVISQLYQSADPAQAQQAAIASASNFQGPPAFQPLNNFFGDITSQYMTNQFLQSLRNPGAAGMFGQRNTFGMPSSNIGPVTYGGIK